MGIASTALSHLETPRAMPGRAVYSIEEVAALLGLSRNSAYTAAREDRLPVPVIKIGRRMSVSRRALDRFLDGEAT